MTDAIKVTVDGEPVAREITLEQVREYLMAKGWTLRDGWGARLLLGPDVTTELWKCPGHAGPLDPAVTIIRPLEGQTDEEIFRTALHNIAAHEGRSPAAVLREIAGESEERPSRIELAAAVDEAHDAIHRVESEMGRFADLLEARGQTGRAHDLRYPMTLLAPAHDILHSVGAGQPRAKTPIEVRADEIEGDGTDPDAAIAEARRALAAGFLVALRLLERQAGR